jgi:hypothetical protein
VGDSNVVTRQGCGFAETGDSDRHLIGGTSYAEKAAAGTSSTGRGEVWVRTDGTLMFTDENGDDFAVSGTGAVAPVPADFLYGDGRHGAVVYTSAGSPYTLVDNVQGTTVTFEANSVVHGDGYIIMSQGDIEFEANAQFDSFGGDGGDGTDFTTGSTGGSAGSAGSGGKQNAGSAAGGAGVSGAGPFTPATGGVAGGDTTGANGGNTGGSGGDTGTTTAPGAFGASGGTNTETPTSDLGAPNTYLSGTTVIAQEWGAGGGSGAGGAGGSGSSGGGSGGGGGGGGWLEMRTGGTLIMATGSKATTQGGSGGDGGGGDGIDSGAGAGGGGGQGGHIRVVYADRSGAGLLVSSGGAGGAAGSPDAAAPPASGGSTGGNGIIEEWNSTSGVRTRTTTGSA